MTPILNKLIFGFTFFRERYFSERKDLYRRLVREGQKPKVVMIACADSRVDPAIVLQTDPGDVFAIRNVANLVPPYEEDENGEISYHGTSAALEFAVEQLGVEHVVVFGHAHCSGVKAMIHGQEGNKVAGRFVGAWTSIVDKAYEHAKAADPHIEGEDLDRACERHAVLVSLDNLMTFPFIRERVEAGTLQIHGWYLDIAEGELSSYDANEKRFTPLM
ncbi:carbonic anhydrase [Magnetovibrio sp.]|uniref:carbonic anhydrase n=1 Tax=Magnetovibrio sp. TaxID=2024836 RepID=UPI002F952FDC